MCECIQIGFAAKKTELCASEQKMHTCLRARKAAPHQICTAVWVAVFPVAIFHQTSRFEVKDSKHVWYRRQPWHSLTWDVKNGSYLHSDCKIIWAVNCIEQPWVGNTPMSGRENWRSDWTNFPVVWAILCQHLVNLYSSKCGNWIHFSLRNDEFTCFVWVMAYLSSKCLSCDPCLAVNPHLTGHTSFHRPSVCDKSLDRDCLTLTCTYMPPIRYFLHPYLHQRQWLLHSYLMCYHYSIKSV